MKDKPVALSPVPLADADWQYVTKRTMDDYRAEDWAVWGPQRKAYFEQNKAAHILRMLEVQKDDPGFVYTTNNYYHCLQTATRMYRANCSEEDVVVGLLHDVGFVACNETHGEFAAALMRPYISERNHWMLVHHAVFQQYHCHELDNCDRHARDRWSGHPHFAWTAEFVERYDQSTISHEEETLPIEAFTGMVERLFAKPPRFDDRVSTTAIEPTAAGVKSMNDQSVGANSTVFLENAWYVAAISGDVERELLPIRLLGRNLVFYRTETGEPVALEDACPHRKLPLSMGRLVGDRVECGYHGLTFGPDGRCVKAPTQDRIPPSAIVRRFPAVDRYGLLWVWMGVSERADEDDIPKIENYDDPAWHITHGDSLTCRCNYLYLIDNLLDPSHVAWVHRTSFAAPGTEDTPLVTEERPDGLVVSRWIYGCDAPPFYRDLLKFTGNCDRLQHYEARFPSLAINKSVFCPAGRGGPDWVREPETYEMVSYNFLTPVDEQTTRYVWLQHRNTDPDDDAVTQRIADGAKHAFEEDRAVLEAVHEGIANETSRHINLALDAGAVRFRQLLQQRIADEAAGSSG